MSDSRKPSKDAPKSTSETQTMSSPAVPSTPEPVTVVIGGVSITVRGPGSNPELIREFEAYLNTAINDVRAVASGSAKVEQLLAAAAMHVTRELFETKEDFAKFKEKVAAEIAAAIQTVETVEARLDDAINNSSQPQVTDDEPEPEPEPEVKEPRAEREFYDFDS